ncbi:hypothetical protein [Chondrinema litorale]|uniref:hypothetical protein n=1 Tax=Chondrinema litorale TaxID=2994555 RepID=UPI002543041F|nr:hypothetical protein [Chondrinema litorale]UZR95577.1 hypothetical protein OQ292_07085 [Chondrinema litorale]
MCIEYSNAYGQINFDIILKLCKAQTSEEAIEIMNECPDWSVSDNQTNSNESFTIEFGENYEAKKKFATSWIYLSIHNRGYSFIYDSLGSDYKGKKDYKRLFRQAVNSNKCIIDEDGNFIHENFKITFTEKDKSCRVGSSKKNVKPKIKTYKIFISKVR